MTFEGINLKGQLPDYISPRSKYSFKTLKTSNLYFEQAISHKNLQANNLSGERNGKILLGTSSTIINSYDALFGIDLGKN